MQSSHRGYKTFCLNGVCQGQSIVTAVFLFHPLLKTSSFVYLRVFFPVTLAIVRKFA